MKIDHCYCVMMLHVLCELTAIDEIEVDVFENFAYLLRIIYAHLLEKVLQLKNICLKLMSNTLEHCQTSQMKIISPKL